MVESATAMPIRVFLASPGDVTDEPQLAREVIDQVGSERAFRGRVSLEVIAWDKPGVGVPMEAGLTPQEAIARGLPKPQACDLVVVILWSRIGTPLPAEYTKADGSPYRSGTEWEYENGIAGFRAQGKPSVWVYRRTEEPTIGLRDPKRKEKEDQWEKLEVFFTSLTNTDGSIAGGVKPYDQPDTFRRLFEQHVRDWLTQHIRPAGPGAPEFEPPDKQTGPETAPRPSPEYLSWLRRECESIELLGLEAQEQHPTRLSQVYVPALTSGSLLLSRVGIESLYVQGDPGAGKSTFCRWLALVAAAEVLPTHTIPDPHAYRETYPEPLRDRLPVLVPLWQGFSTAGLLGL